MDRVVKIILTLAGIALGILLIWYLRTIIIYLIVSAVLALIGRPIVKFFKRIKFKKKELPDALSALLTIISMVLVILAIFSVFIPLVAEEAKILSNVDYNTLYTELQKGLEQFEKYLPQELNEDSVEELLSYVNFNKIKGAIGSIVGGLGNVFVALFSISFITFFFLKDRNMVNNIIFALTPDKQIEKIETVIKNSKNVLTRYFIGLLIQVALFTTMVTIGLLIAGVKNALLIGFIAGIINLIPYVGPLIGAAFGIIIGLSSQLGPGFDSSILLPLTLKIAGTFVVAQLIDNILAQPLIFSNSVNVHPLEIFLVIMAAGTLGGVPGMIIAVPLYSFLRIIAKEFLSQFKVVQSLTK